MRSWVVDDASTDATPAILARLAAGDPLVRVVTRRAPDARRGKGAALNHAYRVLCAGLPAHADRTRIVVGIVDADGLLDRNALAQSASSRVFGDGTVGGAQLAVRMSNRDVLPERGASRLGRRFGRWLVRMQDLEFVGPISAMQLLRERTLSVVLGGNGQFSRLSALDAIAADRGSPWGGALVAGLTYFAYQ